MEVQALTRHTRISARKARDVARVIQGKPAPEALTMLQFIPRKAARLLRKTLQSAIANAENNHELSANDLIVSRALVEQGTAFKRMRPAPRGTGHPIRKETSHLRIILAERPAVKESTDSEQSAE